MQFPCRRVFSSQFQKGRLSFKKLKDKVLVDGSIQAVTLGLPDQYGRLHGVKVNAEHFVQQVAEQGEEAFFPMEYNPLAFDVHGKPIQFGEEGAMVQDRLLLKPDMGQLIESSWMKDEVFVFADAYGMDKTELKYAPRNYLKQALSKVQEQPTSKLSFDFYLSKSEHAKEEKLLQFNSANKGLLTLEQEFHASVGDVPLYLNNVGIPVNQVQDHPVTRQNTYTLSFAPVAGNLLLQADNFHLAKHVIKYTFFQKEIDAHFLPQYNASIYLDLMLELQGVQVPVNTLLQHALFVCPNRLHFRKLSERLDFFKNRMQLAPGLLNYLGPDTNLYQVLGLLASHQSCGSAEEQEVTLETMGSFFEEGVQKFKEMKSELVGEDYCRYYVKVLEHEISEFKLAGFEWEQGRIY